MNKNKLNQIGESRTIMEDDLYSPELPAITLAELREDFTQQQKMINELKKFPNFLSPLLQKFKEIKEKKEMLNRSKKNNPEIEKEYKQIEKKLAEELMDFSGRNNIIEARINDEEWVVLEVVLHCDFSSKDEIISFLKENNLSDLIIKNEVRGAKINKKGQREDIKDVKFDEKRLRDWLNEREKGSFPIPEFFKYNFQWKLKLKKCLTKK